MLFGGYLEEEEGGGEEAGGGAVKRAATNETWKLDRDLKSWEKVSNSSSSSSLPPRSRLAAAGAVASGSAWLLGGWDPGNKGDGGEILGDVWRFDLTENGEGQWSEAELRQPEGEGEGGEEKKGESESESESAAAPSSSSAPLLPPAPATAVALPPGEDPRAFASLNAAAEAERRDLPESIVLPSLPPCSRATAAAIIISGGTKDERQPEAIALFTHRNGGDILLLDTSDPQNPVLKACVVAGDEEAARKKAERAFDGSTALPASRGLSALVSFGNGSSSSPPPSSPSSSSLHLFGGAPKSGPMLDDSWFLEMASGWERRLLGGEDGKKKGDKREGPTLRWSRQTTSSSSSSSSYPPPRCSQAVGVLSEDSLYLFGGAYYDPAGLLPLGDLWRLDLKSREWEEVEIEEVDGARPSPSPRNASAFGVVELPRGKKGLLIHGGWDPFRKTHNDTWLLTEEEEEVVE